MIESPPTLTDHARALVSDFMKRIGAVLYRAGVHPDIITVLGLAVVAIGAFFIMRGSVQLGGVIILLGLPLDAVDGATARAMGRKDKFGSVLDSTLDRYADGFIFGALSYYFAVQARFDFMLLALAAMIGSFVVSYVRARAVEANLSVKIGLFDRFVRVIVLLGALLIPIRGVLEIGVAILAVGTNVTGLQRLWYVYTTLNKREVKGE
jgi:CDP-diacylglycerol--glycerol-3-phosphate 3-phosphatidyltransferase